MSQLIKPAATCDEEESSPLLPGSPGLEDCQGEIMQTVNLNESQHSRPYYKNLILNVHKSPKYTNRSFIRL